MLRAAVACAAQFCKFFKFSHHRLQFSIPHAYIVCIRYDTVLANTSVLCVRVRIVCWPDVATPGECYYNSLLRSDNFSSLSVVSHTFSVLCVYSKFGHHPHPLGYLCVEFCFFRGLHCSASPWRKIAYSITQSFYHPAY